MPDLYRDYLFSNFGNIGGGRNAGTIDGYLRELKEYEGETLSAQVKSYLLSCGITEDQLDSFRRIMLK